MLLLFFYWNSLSLFCWIRIKSCFPLVCPFVDWFKIFSHIITRFLRVMYNWEEEVSLASNLVFSNIPYKSFMYITNNTGHKTEPWDPSARRDRLIRKMRSYGPILLSQFRLGFCENIWMRRRLATAFSLLFSWITELVVLFERKKWEIN